MLAVKSVHSRHPWLCFRITILLKPQVLSKYITVSECNIPFMPKTEALLLINIFISFFSSKFVSRRTTSIHSSSKQNKERSWYVKCESYTFNSSIPGANGSKTTSTSVWLTSSKLGGFHFGFCKDIKESKLLTK